MRVLPVTNFKITSNPTFKAEVVYGSTLDGELTDNEKKRIEDKAAAKPDGMYAFSISGPTFSDENVFLYYRQDFRPQFFRNGEKELPDSAIDDLLDTSKYMTQNEKWPES